MASIIKTIATKDDLEDFVTEISKAHAGLIKWMFISSITQVAAFWLMLELLMKK